jgi:hypothetical protein
MMKVNDALLRQQSGKGNHAWFCQGTPQWGLSS